MPRPKQLKEVLENSAANSSWHGITHIVSSRQIPVKLLWASLFLATSVVLGIQMVTLFQEYYAFKIKTSVSLQYHPIEFPAITFCNMNPVKKSRLKEFDGLEQALSPKKEVKKRPKRDTGNSTGQTGTTKSPEKTTQTDTSNSDSDTDSSESKTDTGTTIKPTSVSTAKKNSSDDDNWANNWYTSSTNNYTGYNQSYLTGKYKNISHQSDNRSSSSYYEDYWANYWYASSTNNYTGYNQSYLTGKYNNISHHSGTDLDSSGEYLDFIIDQFYSPKDAWTLRSQSFQTHFRNETMETRGDIGHLKEDMVLSATYSGIIQNISMLQSTSSMEYGNCYTMSSSNYKAWKSGPATGIKLTFNLEIDEYLQNLASGYGIRMVFHDRGTFPLPEEEGITLSPGFDTNIGLRMVRVIRLGQPYGECSDGVAFEEKYKLKYSITACMQFCRVEKIVATCGCFPSDGPDVVFAKVHEVRICGVSSLNDKICQLAVDASFNAGTTDCACISPCSESVYEKTMSGRVWPKDDFLINVLMADVCKSNISSMAAACEEMNNNTLDLNRYKSNFLQVQVYFEDLNFEVIEQEPLYEYPRFLSDIGGAMGLFMGGSLLSIVEILQLMLEVFLFFRNKNMDTNAGNRVGDAPDDSVTDKKGPIADPTNNEKQRSQLSMTAY